VPVCAANSAFSVAAALVRGLHEAARMKRFAARTLSLSLLCLAACANEDLGEDPLAAEALALADQPTVQMLPSVVGGSAIALTVRNTAASPIFCRSAAFRAPIQRLDHCGEPALSSELIELKDLAFAAGEAKIWAATADATSGGLLGEALIAQVAADRQRQGFGDEILEFCPMGGSERVLDCGYYCGSHPYGEDYTVSNAEGGWKKYHCEENGTASNTETRCVGDVAVGTSVRQPGGPGYTIVATCQADGTFLRTAECSAGYQQTADRLACVEAWCGATPPGGELLVGNVEHGRIVTTCHFGQGDPNSQRAVCDAEFVANPLNNGCVPRPPRDCGPGRPHGYFNTYEDCIPGGAARVVDRCNDGHWSHTVTPLHRMCR
jgi:hypothetical protein